MHYNYPEKKCIWKSFGLRPHGTRSVCSIYTRAAQGGGYLLVGALIQIRGLHCGLPLLLQLGPCLPRPLRTFHCLIHQGFPCCKALWVLQEADSGRV